MRVLQVATAIAAATCAIAGCQEPLIPGPPHENKPSVDQPRFPDGGTETTFEAPVHGGTLAVSSTGKFAVAAAPEMNRVWIVDLDAWSIAGSVQLSPEDEPGRVTITLDGRVFVVLRRTGQIGTFNLATLQLVRWPVCTEPRGIAFDEAANELHVACATGTLVTLSGVDGAELRRTQLDDDLRDVSLVSGGLLALRFKTAELLHVDAFGAVSHRTRPPTLTLPQDGGTKTFEPAVAWRLATSATGGFVIAHQRAQAEPIALAPSSGFDAGKTPSAYGGGSCGGIVRSALTYVDSAGSTFSVLVPGALPVDVAVSPSGHFIAVANASGTGALKTKTSGLSDMPLGDCSAFFTVTKAGATTAVAFKGELVLAQTHRGLIDEHGRLLPFPDSPAPSMGHSLFHTETLSGVACASCHPEGGEDGRVWAFEPIGPRRTQSLRGGIADTAPFHWDGDLASLSHLMVEVFGNRMGNGVVEDQQVSSLATFIDRIRSLAPRATDAESIVRGKALFEAAEVGCGSCHAGPKLTNSTSADVGTGRSLQVPQLLSLWSRAPFMHDGCAATLADRFGPCGGGDAHGKTSHLTEAERADLIAYMESL